MTTAAPRRGSHLRLLAAALGAVASVTALAQQDAATPAAYGDAVAAYEAAGDLEPARRMAAASTRRQFETAVGRLRAGAPRLALAASVLQLELALGAVEASPDDAMWHVRLGEQLLDAAVRDGGSLPDTAVARWSVVASSIFQARTDLARARAALAYGLNHRPRDALVRLHAGILEDLASLLAENDDSGLPDRRSTMARSVTRSHMASAERAYREALAIAPATHSATIRLGRLLHRRGRFADARQMFEQAQTATVSATEAYLLLLFLSATYEALDEPALARTALQDAVRAAGNQQGAWLALAQFEERVGQPERARSVILQGLVRARSADTDAWWDYRHGGFDGEGLAWLRGIVRSRR